MTKYNKSTKWGSKTFNRILSGRRTNISSSRRLKYALKKIGFDTTNLRARSPKRRLKIGNDGWWQTSVDLELMGYNDLNSASETIKALNKENALREKHSVRAKKIVGQLSKWGDGIIILDEKGRFVMKLDENGNSVESDFFSEEGVELNMQEEEYE